MIIPDWFWIAFMFAFGCCIGSFLNVVIYRLPRDKSLVKPPSACPACNRHIRFYDNIPLVSYLLLGRKCRYCKAPISPRYFIIELITGVTFVATYWILFRSYLRAGVPAFLAGGWFIYLITVVLLSALIASSAIDLELWIIPLSACWIVTIAGIIVSAVAPLLIDHRTIRGWHLLPHASATTAALAFGGAVGLIISVVLLAKGVIKRSYDFASDRPENEQPAADPASHEPTQGEQAAARQRINHRLEVLREVVFLGPIVVCALVALWLTQGAGPLRELWLRITERPVIAGLFGSIFAYFVGCGIVWVTRILGTLVFGREAMGLGDVHLMGAAAACIGAVPAVVAFFVAPFFGLGWALVQLFFKKSRQIPYGPFLSLGVFVVIIAHDRIWGYLAMLFG
jgi:leader peptidase (prepilin peptidase)/N-methyltransferase